MYNLRNFKRAVADIRSNGGLIKNADGLLRAWWLRAQLKVGIAQALADSVHTDQGTRAQKVLALQGTRSHRILLSPDTVHVLREELRRG